MTAEPSRESYAMLDLTRVWAEDLEWIESYSARTGRTVEALVREALSHFVDTQRAAEFAGGSQLTSKGGKQ